ncbi:MAG: hypothetical protein HY094_00675 [Candidatus Melainabacteria bacterium]|nr:hypothetical protein [Candidatus Melainabacteria bacterium]
MPIDNTNPLNTNPLLLQRLQGANTVDGTAAVLQRALNEGQLSLQNIDRFMAARPEDRAPIEAPLLALIRQARARLQPPPPLEAISKLCNERPLFF